MPRLVTPVSDETLEFMIYCSLEKGKFIDAGTFVPVLFKTMARNYRLRYEAEPKRAMLDEAIAERLDVLRESAALTFFARAKEHAVHGMYNHDVKEPMHRTLVQRAVDVVLAPIAGYASQTARYRWIPQAALQLDMLYECTVAFSRQ
jgi:hypothetical protein